ncbi:uncharacterized protein LOC144032889 [Festucalex cinctus]
MGLSFNVRLVVVFGLCWTCTATLFRCPADWREYQDHCYFFSTDNKNWNDAQAHCASKGGNLASVLDRDEQSYLTSRTWRWIGLWRENANSEWMWTDGSPFAPSVTFWASGRPDNLGGNENCGEASGSVWNDYRCSFLQGYICKKQALARSSTTKKPAAAVQTTTLPMTPPPTTKICGSACSSNQTGCSCKLDMNEEAGWGKSLTGVLTGLSVDRTIVISGKAQANAEKLSIILSESNPDEIMLRLELNFELQTATLESYKTDKQFKKLPGQVPFGAGLDFKIVIKCKDDAFSLTFNNSDDAPTNWNYDEVGDLKRVNRLTVTFAKMVTVLLQ